MKHRLKFAASTAMGLFFTVNTLSHALAQEAIPAGLLSLGNDSYFAAHAFVVDKKSRTLSIWENAAGQLKKVAEYPSDFGKNTGTKRTAGDRKTPEGIYFLQRMLEGKSLDFRQYGVRAFTTDYPNLFDQRAGKTGDGIWLHAIPDSETLERGSKGCVVVRNKSILEFSKYIKLGQTPILIFDEVSWIPADDVKRKSGDVLTFFENWRKAWVSKDITNYISAYSNAFESQKMDRAKWQEFKKGLADKYSTIEVQFSQPMILQFQDQLVVRALQKYRSDQHEDFGEKTLYLRDENGSLRIVGETWQPVPNSQVEKEIMASTPVVSNARPEAETKQAN